jgi:hypothetical protein
MTVDPLHLIQIMLAQGSGCGHSSCSDDVYAHLSCLWIGGLSIFGKESECEASAFSFEHSRVGKGEGER